MPDDPRANRPRRNRPTSADDSRRSGGGGSIESVRVTSGSSDPARPGGRTRESAAARRAQSTPAEGSTGRARTGRKRTTGSAIVNNERPMPMATSSSPVEHSRMGGLATAVVIGLIVGLLIGLPIGGAVLGGGGGNDAGADDTRTGDRTATTDGNTAESTDGAPPRIPPPADDDEPDASGDADTEPLFAEIERQRVAVERVRDGDTFEANIRFDNAMRLGVRLLNVDTLETNDARPAYRAIAEEAKQAISDMIAGRHVTLEFGSDDGPQFDAFGRILAYVFVGETLVNEELIRRGLAIHMTEYGRGRYSDDFERIEEEARIARRGLWAIPEARAEFGATMININTATAEELDRLDGIGPALAARIIAYREEHGPFLRLADLAAVAGVGQALVDGLAGKATTASR